MSLIDNVDLVDIKMYYKYIETDYGKKLIILDDKKAEDMLKDEEKGKGIEMLETQWSILNWKEQNEVVEASSKDIDPITRENKFNFLVYRDVMIKKCLRSWNITTDDKPVPLPVPVTSDAIDKLPGPVVTNIYQKFEKYIDFNEEETGN